MRTVRRTVREQYATRCVNFTGMQNAKCKAGVVYKSFQASALPCFSDEGNGAGCAACRFPTQAEADAYEAEHKKHMAKMMTALTVVGPIKKAHKGKNWNGTVVCPVCKGKLHVSHAALNGHVWGKCETHDCVMWME